MSYQTSHYQPRPKSIVDLVKSTINPKIYTCLPPSILPITTFSKRFDATGNFQVNDSALTHERVPTSSGAVVWFPHHGTQGLYRFGIVPGGATRAPWTASLIQTIFPDVTTFTYWSPLPVPYNYHVASDVVTISPNLSTLKTTSAPDYQLFSKARVVTGDIYLRCETIPIGNTALNGIISATAISDWRDVVQTGFSDFTLSGTTFEPSQLVQASVTQKDGIKEVSGMDGAHTVLGPDIAQSYSPPNEDTTDLAYQGAVLFCLPVIDAYAGVLGAGVSHLRALIWYSPWNTSLTDSSNFCTRQNFNYGPIDPFSVLEARFSATLVPVGAQPAGYTENWFLRVDHVWASCTSTAGNVNYQTVTEILDLTTGGPDAFVFQYFTRDVPSPSLYKGQFAGANPIPSTFQASGMYLGTQLSLFVQNNSAVDGSVAPMTVTAPQLFLRARNLYQPGALGPLRILKWDAFSDNQNLRMDGVFFADCVPGGTTAPFVQESAMRVQRCLDVNSITVLSELYNGETPFRRIWGGKEYTSFNEQFVRTLDMPLLKELAYRAFPEPTERDKRERDAENYQ